jgi:hypothetical protein
LLVHCVRKKSPGPQILWDLDLKSWLLRSGPVLCKLFRFNRPSSPSFWHWNLFGRSVDGGVWASRPVLLICKSFGFDSKNFFFKFKNLWSQFKNRCVFLLVTTKLHVSQS